MPIKRRKIKIRKKPKTLSQEEAFARMAAILAAGKGTEEHARHYFELFYKDQLARLQSIAARADKERNWEFMEGCYKQATELYVLASVLYEKYPEHVIMSDGAFDHLARWLIKHKDDTDIDFWNWYNVKAMGLEAGSGYNVAVRPPIIAMVYLLTGQLLEETDGTSRSQDRPRILRRGSKRGKQRTEGEAGKPTRKTIRRKSGGRKSDQPNEAAKKDRPSGTSTRRPRRKSKRDAD